MKAMKIQNQLSQPLHKNQQVVKGKRLIKIKT